MYTVFVVCLKICYTIAYCSLFSDGWAEQPIYSTRAVIIVILHPKYSISFHKNVFYVLPRPVSCCMWQSTQLQHKKTLLDLIRYDWQISTIGPCSSPIGYRAGNRWWTSLPPCYPRLICLSQCVLVYLSVVPLQLLANSLCSALQWGFEIENLYFRVGTHNQQWGVRYEQTGHIDVTFRQCCDVISTESVLSKFAFESIRMIVGSGDFSTSAVHYIPDRVAILPAQLRSWPVLLNAVKSPILRLGMNSNACTTKQSLLLSQMNSPAFISWQVFVKGKSLFRKSFIWAGSKKACPQQPSTDALLKKQDQHLCAI